MAQKPLKIDNAVPVAANDPLTPEQAGQLLLPHEIVRDPVQRDITITALERAIIDTPAFQRLRGLVQLGPTHLVYPGAVHTRFLHSLGTLQAAEQMVRTANHNYRSYSGDADSPPLVHIEAYPHLLIRLCALLHDLAHVPFGHTLDDEGNFCPMGEDGKPAHQWKDPGRLREWLDEDKEIPRAIVGFLTASGIPEANAKAVSADVRRYICHTGMPEAIKHPFVCDVVGNTICADLLDYLDRDMYFCGLRERSGDRITNYLAVVATQRQGEDVGPSESFRGVAGGQGRLALLAYRMEHEHGGGGTQRLVRIPKPEILSEAIDLLRRRFALAEKVYFHRTKLAASAMLISAFQAARVDLKDVYSLTDVELVSRLEKADSSRAKHLAEAFGQRHLYWSVYRLDYREERDDDPESARFWERYKVWRSPAWREQQERYIEETVGLRAGTIAIYCPERDMNLKGFDVLVHMQPDALVKRLRSVLLDDNRRQEMEAIGGRHERLWSLHVFIDPREVKRAHWRDRRAEDVSRLCEGDDVFGFPNGYADLRSKGRPAKSLS